MDPINYLESGTLPTDDSQARKTLLEANNFSLLDGTPYYAQTDGRLRLPVPNGQRKKLIEKAHGGLFSGHLQSVAMKILVAKDAK